MKHSDYLQLLRKPCIVHAISRSKYESSISHQGIQVNQDVQVVQEDVQAIEDNQEEEDLIKAFEIRWRRPLCIRVRRG